MKTLFTGMSFLLLSLVLSGCNDSADIEKIRNNVQVMRQAIQDHDRHAFMKHIAPRYRGQDHGNRPSLENFLIKQLNKNKNIYIYLADIDIEIKDNIAKVILFAGTAGGPDQIPERGQLYKVQTTWRQYSGHWQVTNARWRPALTSKNL